MRDYQEKILNYILFFLLSLTGLSSLLLVKNNYLYVFILLFLLFYWQRFKVRQVLARYFSYPPSFPLFLTLGMVGVLLFQVFSRSPRFYQRPILTLIVSLIFYLPYFFLWYKIFLRRKNAVLETFFLSGFGGIIIFGLIFKRLTTTVLTAPNLASGLFYALLKASGIFTVVGALTAVPFLFFSDEKGALPVKEEEKKKNSPGFGLIEVLVGVGLFLIALGLVGTARHRQNIAQHKLAEIKQSRAERLANLREKVKEQRNKIQSPIKQVTPVPTSIPTPTNIPEITEGEVKKPEDKEQPRPQADTESIEKKENGRATTEQHQVEDKAAPRPQTGKDDQEQKEFTDEDFDAFYDQVATYDTCQTNPSIPGCEVYYYDPYEDPNSPEYQQQLMEEWYYSQQDPSELFFNDPMQLWSQDPGMYEMFEGIYNFEPIPGFP